MKSSFCFALPASLIKKEHVTAVLKQNYFVVRHEDSLYCERVEGQGTQQYNAALSDRGPVAGLHAALV